MYAGNVYNCYSTGNVTRTKSQYYIGGLIGQTHGTFTIHDCYATGTVTTCSHFAGGLIGIHDYGNLTLNKCYATANIVATATKVANFGGLVGHVSGTVTININDCYATGNVGSIAGQNYVRRWCGGLIGATSDESTITISNSYSTSSFTTYATPNGALIGNNSSISVTCTGYIGWSSLTAFAGYGNAVSTTDNYLGQEGTISSHASSLGWSTVIWDLTGSVPTLK